jgi:hypothetical protein
MARRLRGKRSAFGGRGDAGWWRISLTRQNQEVSHGGHGGHGGFFEKLANRTPNAKW